MLLRRREFLKYTSLASASLWLPDFLRAYQRPGALAHRGKILLALQLSGGNDGLNTLIPVRNDMYYKARPRIAIKAAEALPLTDEAGLHPALGALRDMYQQGHLAVLNQVGYPNPDRSHFRSMDIWHSASNADAYWNTGWIGRYLDATCAGHPRATDALEIDDTLSLALKGASRKGLALQDARRLYESTHSDFFKEYAAAYATPAGAAEEPATVDYLYKTMAESLASADYLFERSRARESSAAYPDTGMGRQLKTIASLILADADTSVYYLSHGSFDTHVNQQGQHQRLFKEMNDALAVFYRDLQAAGRWQDVLILTFSEFGRRVSQNAAGGTDHGTANNLFLMGGGLKQAGLLNALPDLSDLDNGDLRYRLDFRQVYATILQNWLQTDADNILGARFEPLGFV
jgi:uncharacterized protein (DUF1501 family)